MKSVDILGQVMMKIYFRFQNGRLYAVHRIDKDTSGIVIYAKNADAHKKDRIKKNK